VASPMDDRSPAAAKLERPGATLHWVQSGVGLGSAALVLGALGFAPKFGFIAALAGLVAALAGGAQAAARRNRAGLILSMIAAIVVLLNAVNLAAYYMAPRLFPSYVLAQQGAAEAQWRMLKSALDTMRLDIGRYPTAAEGLALLIGPPQDPETSARWHGPYLDGPIPNDPWGRPYIYSPDGKDGSPIALYSYGPSGKPGGTIIGYPPRD
jgi:general secretion pathway protein G